MYEVAPFSPAGTTSIVNVIQVFWCICIASSLVVYLFPNYFGVIARHGKLCSISLIGSNNSNSSASPYFDLNSEYLYVPKRYFTHFYVVGILMTSALSLFASTSNLVLLMFLAHLIRRLWECLYISHFGDSKMHIIGYICGLAHYIAAPITLTLTFVPRDVISVLMSPTSFVTLGLFLVANVEQHRIHRILFIEKSKRLKVRRIPTGFWFNYVTCPHYTSEILIYSSLCVAVPSNRSAQLLLLWVISNLAVVSDEQYSWYMTHCSSSDIPASWKRIVPFLW